MEILDGNRELRKLPTGSLNTIIDILEIDDCWQTLMSKIPKNPEDLNSGLKYNSEHIRLIKDYVDCSKLKGAKVLFEEWGTSGRIRPTLHSLMKILAKAKLYRAADEIADMLNVPRPSRPSDGPEAPIDTNNITALLETRSMGQKTTAQMKSNKNDKQTVEEQKKVTKEMTLPGPFQNEWLIPDIDNLNPQSDVMVGAGYSPNTGTTTENSSISDYSDQSMSNYSDRQTDYSLSDYSKVIHDIDTDLLENSNLIQFEYRFLVTITRNFTKHIGSGGFGDVYIGTDPNYGQLAIKKARNQHSVDSRVDFIKIFNREVRSLSHLRHENIVPILGFSLTGPNPCIVCRYIDGGSLLQKLADKILSETERINIIVGVSEGLKYIHNTVVPNITREMKEANVKYYFLHGDVKSANILLTREFVPKLCDFGLAKQYTSTHFTTSIMGTSPYMAPESYHGTVTQKSDIYSFGVVLLEILTGLKPVVKTSQGDVNLRSYIKDNFNGDIANVLDSATEWTKALEIYKLAKLCLKEEKEKRPSMVEIIEMLCVIKKLRPKSTNVVQNNYDH